jgi:hypothetical protein
MDNILWIADIGDSLNHVHEIRGIWEVLHWIIHGPPELIPNEVKYAKPLFVLCNPIEEIGSIVPQGRSISLLRINGGAEELIEIVVVGVELIRLALNSQVTTRKHVREVPRLVLVLIVDRSAVFIL